MRDWLFWIKAAAIRAVKTMAQTAIATIGSAYVFADVNWSMVLSATCLAGLLSIFTSLAGLPEENKEEDVQIYRFGEDESDDI